MKPFTFNTRAFWLGASLFLVVAFQNCGQKGDLVLTDTPIDTLQIDPINLDDTRDVASDEESADTTSPENGAGSEHNSNSDDSQVSTNPVPEPSHPTEPWSDEADSSEAKHACWGLKVSDILLQINSVLVTGDKRSSPLALLEVDPLVTMTKKHIKLKALKNTEVSQLMLVLDSEGNKLLSDNSQVVNLKTPSGQTAGVKVQLDESVLLLAQRNYLLELEIDPQEQIVANANHCIFKPVIKSAKLHLE